MKHTKGPWKLDTELGTHGASICVRAETIYVADVFKTDDSLSRMSDDKMAQANAKLIAAAPELLEALKLAAQYVQTYLDECGPCKDTEDVMTTIQIVLDKAEGE